MGSSAVITRPLRGQGTGDPTAIIGNDVAGVNKPSLAVADLRPTLRKTMDDFWVLQGWYKVHEGHIVRTPAEWDKNPEVRLDAVRFLVDEVLRVDPRDVLGVDFRNNGLEGLLVTHFNNRSYDAISSAYSSLGIKPWETKRTPYGFFEEKQNRIAAVKWLVEEKLQIKPAEIDNKDFSPGLYGMFLKYYNCSPYAAISEAYPEVKPWEMKNSPLNIFESADTRIEATRWLVTKLGKKPEELTRDDFISNRLWNLISRYYSDSPYRAVSEAYPELNMKPWQMKRIPRGFFDSLENRIEATRWLAEQSGKKPTEIDRPDFKAHGLGAFLKNRYGNSHYTALREASLISEEEERTMRRRAMERAQQNRINTLHEIKSMIFSRSRLLDAVIQVLALTGKSEFRDLRASDFAEHGLSRIASMFSGGVYGLLSHLDLVEESDSEYMAASGNKRRTDRNGGVGERTSIELLNSYKAMSNSMYEQGIRLFKAYFYGKDPEVRRKAALLLGISYKAALSVVSIHSGLGTAHYSDSAEWREIAEQRKTAFKSALLGEDQTFKDQDGAISDHAVALQKVQR